MAPASTWQRLGELDVYRVVEIPHRSTGRVTADAMRERQGGCAQRMAALVSAYHAAVAADPATGPGLVVFGWVRPAAGGPLQVLAAGETVAGSVGDGEVLLALPSGARGRILAPGALPDLLCRVPCWQPVGGVSDGLLATDPTARSRRPAPPPSLEEGLLSSWTEPFAWLVIAEAVRGDELRRLADWVAERERLARGMVDRFPQRAVEVRRLAHRHAELCQASSTGLWCVRLLAGGEDPRCAARIAGLLCASLDLDGLPYVLAPTGGGRAPDDARALVDNRGDAVEPGDGSDMRFGFPFHAGSELVAAIIRPPTTEVPGVRLTLRPDFDVTPESSIVPAAGTPARRTVTIGQVLDGNRMPAGELRLPLTSLNRHVFVCGSTGAGKSQTIRALLEAAAEAGIPWLVVEPAKAEYRLMAARLPGTEVVRIRPGEADAIAAGLNPLEPAHDAAGNRFPLQTHADLVRALFLASFQPEEPLPQVLAAALSRAYEEAGWDLALGEPIADGGTARYPSLTDLQRAAEQVITEIGYHRDVEANVRGFVRVRLASLRHGTTGRFLDGGHPIDVDRLLARNVVLEIEDVGDDRDKAFLMGTVLIRLTEHLRLTPRGGADGSTGLRHLTVFEEAHRLLRRADRHGPAAHAVELFAGLLAEVRAYGEGLIIADQIPARLVPDVIKNTAVKITHRLPAADDRDVVGATMNITEEQSRYLVTLAPGEAAVFADGMDHPLLAKMPDGTAREATGGGMTAEAAEVVAPRSVTCGAECSAWPCTLRDMRRAAHTLRRDPVFSLWTELAVLAHLTGWPMPVPRTALLDRIRATPTRVRDCAIAHGVDAAVAARIPVIAATLSPIGLAGHVAAAMRAWSTDHRWTCEPMESAWLAPTHRWVAGGVTSPGGPGTPPGTGPRPEVTGLDRTPQPTGRQDPAPRDAPSRPTGDVDAPASDIRAVAFGVDTPSIIEQVVGVAAVDESFHRRLVERLDWFVDCRWPLLYLR